MKKLLLVLAVALAALSGRAQDARVDSLNQKIDSLQQAVQALSTSAEAKDASDLDKAIWKDRAKWFSLGIGKQTLIHQDVPGLEWNSELAISAMWGRTYYFPKKAWFGMLKVGIDFSWMDITYAKYKDVMETADGSMNGGYGNGYDDYYDSYDGDEDIDLGVWQAEYALRLGPSVTINPVHHLKVGLYAHFVPTASAISMNDEVNVQFVPNFAFGGSIAWKVISVGFEGRWGEANYKSFSVDDEAVDGWEDGSDANLDDVLKQDKNRLKTKFFRFYLAFRF